MVRNRFTWPFHRTGPLVLTTFLLLILLSACFGKYPAQVVELNVTVGKDIEALHRSYSALIDTHFDTLRTRVNQFIKNRWMPVFIKDFKQRGNFDQLVKSGNSERMNMWTAVVMETIENKRSQLLAPIDAKQKELQGMVDQSFDLLVKANREITEHLKSRGKISDALETVRGLYTLKPLRDKIVDGLAEATNITNNQTSNNQLNLKGDVKQ